MPEARAVLEPYPAPGAKPHLGSIQAVTYATPDLTIIEDAYVGQLGYQVVERRPVSDVESRSWDAPAAAGRPMLVLGPASGEAVYLRFVESSAAAGWRALKTFGWNATEFVVQDVDTLAERLEGGPFTIIGPPKGLTRFPMIRAMQAIGPAGECCYFTEVGAGSGLELAKAQSFVGRVFIVVCAGPDADALYAPYAAFANATDPPVATPVKVISDAHGLPADALHRHGLVRLPGGTLIELDAYPETALPRPVAEGELAPGMAMVSFAIDGPEHRCLRGAVGELIELTPAEHGSTP